MNFNTTRLNFLAASLFCLIFIIHDYEASAEELHEDILFAKCEQHTCLQAIRYTPHPALKGDQAVIAYTLFEDLQILKVVRAFLDQFADGKWEGFIQISNASCVFSRREDYWKGYFCKDVQVNNIERDVWDAALKTALAKKQLVEKEQLDWQIKKAREKQDQRRFLIRYFLPCLTISILLLASGIILVLKSTSKTGVTKSILLIFGTTLYGLGTLIGTVLKGPWYALLLWMIVVPILGGTLMAILHSRGFPFRAVVGWTFYAMAMPLGLVYLFYLSMRY